MPKYLVIIHGQDILTKFGGETKLRGFYKSVKVNVPTPAHILKAALTEMRKDETFMRVIVAPDELDGCCIVEEYQHWRFRIRHGFLKGATFYSEDD